MRKRGLILRALAPAIWATVAIVPGIFAASLAVAQNSPEEKFWAACRNGDVAVVRESLDKGLNANMRFPGGTTPLSAAAMRGQAEVVKLLLERGADPSLRDDTFKATPLGMATFFGHMQVVQILLPLSTQDLDIVLKFGAMLGAAPLLEAGLKGKPSPQDLTIAWMMAKRAKKDDLVAILEKAGAKPPGTLSPEALQRFVGNYRNAQGREFELALRDGKLIGTGGTGFGEFFEVEFFVLTDNALMNSTDPFTNFTFEGGEGPFERVTIASSGSSYVVTRSKGAGK